MTAPFCGLGWSPAALSPWQREACVASASAAVSDRVVGHVVLLAYGGESAPALTSALLYRALARQVPTGRPATGDMPAAVPNQGLAANTARRWRDIDPALPDAPIRVLVPPEGSPEARILAERVLQIGCLAAALPVLPRSPAERRGLCMQMRADEAVVRATPAAGPGAWLRGAGPSAVALVGLQAVRADAGLEAPLPLDGVTPAFASIANGTYPAAVPVRLVMAQAGAAAAAADATGRLTAESVIGPGGGFAQRGFAALTAMERVRLRAE